ncbi:hypothetical protein OV203_11925 [Nannocystis sp. ILAH1]|uniref:hypothetical protein n=1 Tax=unclassified Nannocystis TaxID=2627009 RepID=UPI00226FB076|nr:MULTISPECIES: hypothetical protein [unclassified Nannocystis]MCY0987836.1 hypothetical protein [Nannocystis sp. ILAH1]MCY1070360.1 hypothetical protein [Nannocystis sp. RBIL2]
MHLFKMTLGAALVAGSLSGCVIGTGGTDTNITSLGSDSTVTAATDSTAGTETTDTTAGTDSTDGTATDSDGTDGTATTPTTTTAPTTTDATTTTTTTTTSTTTDTGGALCGWSPRDNYYSCNFEGEDPEGTHPIACPTGLVEGDPCATTGLTGEGCCDENGDNWYCGEENEMQIVVLASCS